MDLANSQIRSSCDALKFSVMTLPESNLSAPNRSPIHLEESLCSPKKSPALSNLVILPTLCSNKEQLEIKAKKRSRRTSDQWVVDEGSLQPSSDLFEDPESLEISHPIPLRRSARLKRKSIELYRSSIKNVNTSPETNGLDLSHNSPLSDSLGQSNELPADSLLKLMLDHAPEKKISKSLLSVDGNDIRSGSISPQTSLDGNCLPTEPEAYSGSNDTNVHMPKLDRRRSQRLFFSNGQPIVIETPKISKKIKKIYLNELWQDQLPKPIKLETIEEENSACFFIITKKFTKQYKGNKAQFRFINFDEPINPDRVRQRRLKAGKLGWKPMSKRRWERAERLVEKMLSNLEQP